MLAFWINIWQYNIFCTVLLCYFNKHGGSSESHIINRILHVRRYSVTDICEDSVPILHICENMVPILHI